MSQSIQQLAQLILQIDPSFEQSSITDLSIGVLTLDDIVAYSSKATIAQIDKIIDIVDLSLNQHPDVSLLHSSHLIDFVVSLMIRHPKLATKKKNRTNRLFVAICKAFIKIPFDILEEWMNPPNGYTQDNEQSSLSPQYQAQKQLISTFQSLSQIIKSKQTLQHFQPFFKQLILNTTDWRYQYAAITLASQIGEEQQKVDKYDLYIQTAINLLQSPNPKIRYACFHLIGQYSDEMKPEFQEKYYDLIVPQMIKFFQDPVPRVVAHSYSCFTNFFENINEVWKIEEFFSQILPISTYYLKNANTWVKQSVVSSLSSLATTKDAFGPYLTQTLEIINEFITQYTSIPEYKHCIEMSFQFISLVLHCQNKQYVEQYVTNFKNLLFSNKNHIGEEYFIGSWNRLCSSYKSFTNLSQVMDSLLETVNNILNSQSDTVAEQALQSLCNTCDSFRMDIVPYVPQLVTISKNIIDDQNKSTNLRQKSVQLLYKIAYSTKSTDASAAPGWKDEIYKQIINFMISKTHHSELLWQLFLQLANLFKLGVSELNSEEVSYYFQSMKNNQNQLMNNLNAAYECIAEQQKKDEEEEIDSNDIDYQHCLQSLRCAADELPQCFQALLKAQYPQTKQTIIAYMIQTSSFYVQKQNQAKLYGLNLLLPLLLECSYQQISHIWSDIMNLYFSFTQDPFSQLRNCVVYGLGEMFLKMPLEHINQNNLIEWLQKLWQAYSTPYTTDKGENLIGHSKDNVISAIGKLIFKCDPKFPHIIHKKIYQCWVAELPLNEDLLEGNTQQQYLVDLLDKNPSILVESCDDLKKILIIYSKFIKARYSENYKQIQEKTKLSLTKIMSWPIFKESQIYLWNNLSNSQRNILTRALTK